MTTSARPLLLAALAAAALGGCKTAPAAQAPAPAAPPAAEAPAAEGPEGALPGVSLEGLTQEQKELVADFARSEFCHCGCPHTVSACLRSHHGCKHAPRMARLAVHLVRAGANLEALRRTVTAYYASFDRRSKLEVGAFGPPFGEADAPVTIVEFSDFTCPFCQRLRPDLEKFVEARASRVRLFYKPFPIEQHPGALDAAQAGEWARDAGLFWPMHDALFSARDHGVDDLATAAREVGGDPADLRDALSAGKYVSKVRGSQVEARTAGLRGTPTLFLDGRMYTLPDFSEASLEFTLEDEEEWKAHGGWERD
jgi:protein-disulfide isomerase